MPPMYTYVFSNVPVDMSRPILFRRVVVIFHLEFSKFDEPAAYVALVFLSMVAILCAIHG